jgi:hypothetical protein
VWEQDFLALDLPAARFDGVFANARSSTCRGRAAARARRARMRRSRRAACSSAPIPRGDNQEGWNGGRYGAWHDLDAWRGFLTPRDSPSSSTTTAAGIAARAAAVARERVEEIVHDASDKDAPLATTSGSSAGSRRHHPCLEGDRTFELVEEIRKLAVASRRLEDQRSRQRLAHVLDALTTEEAVAVVRAFSYFSLLANIAEDATTSAATATTGARAPRRSLHGARLFADARGRGARASRLRAARNDPRASSAHRAIRPRCRARARSTASSRSPSACGAWTRPTCCRTRSSARSWSCAG